MMMAPCGVPALPEARGREPPFFLFFLDLLPRCEKGFPSGSWSPWRGRGESPSVEDIATEYKPARRVRFTLDYVKAHEDQKMALY